MDRRPPPLRSPPSEHWEWEGHRAVDPVEPPKGVLFRHVVCSGERRLAADVSPHCIAGGCMGAAAAAAVRLRLPIVRAHSFLHWFST